MKEKLYIVKFTHMQGDKQFCFNSSRSNVVWHQHQAKRYTKCELDDAIVAGDTWVNSSYQTEILALDEWK